MKNTTDGTSQKSQCGGFSLVELMIAIVLLSIVGIGLRGLFNFSRVAVGRAELRQIAESARGMASTITSLHNSAAGNPLLADCLSTRNCNFPTWRFFELRGPAPGQTVAGAAVFYDSRSMQRCNTPGTGTCVMNVRAQFEGAGSILRVRIMADKSDERVGSTPYDPVITPPVSFDLRERQSSGSCPQYQGMTSVDPATGNPICTDNTLPAGATNCGAGQAVSRLDQFGRAVCFSPPAGVNTTNLPSGFFLQNTCGRLGVFVWGDCKDIQGLNELFPDEQANFTCNWLSPNCSFTHRVRIWTTCCSGGPPPVCNPCSYCQDVSTVTYPCPVVRTGSSTAGPGNFDCETTRPGNCPFIVPGDCEGPPSCDPFVIQSASGTMRCNR